MSDSVDCRTERRWLALLVLAILCVKLPLLAIYGPVQAPDSSGYIQYAQFLLSDGKASLAISGNAHQSVFRIIGYPALIAGAMLAAGDFWPWPVVALQIGLTLAVTLLLVRLLRRLTGRLRWGLAGGLAYALSLPLVLDQMILTDSIAGSLLALAAGLLALRIAAGRRLTAPAALGIGLLLLLAFLVREATLILAGVGILPLALLAAVADRLPLRAGALLRRPPWRAGLVALLVVLPLLAGAQGYRQWNQSRFGVAFITTAAQTTIPQAMAIVAQRHPAIFDRSQLFDRVAADSFVTYDFSEIWTISQRLHAEYGLTADRIAAAAYDSYFRAWRRAPLQMLRIPLHHLRPGSMRAWLQPVPAVLLLDLWATGQGASLRRDILAGRWSLAPVYLLDLLCVVVAMPVFAAFLLGTPWRLWRQGLTPAAAACFGLWALFLALYAGYALVHLEPRYLVGVMPALTAVGMCNMIDLWRWHAARRAAAADKGTGNGG